MGPKVAIFLAWTDFWTVSKGLRSAGIRPACRLCCSTAMRRTLISDLPRSSDAAPSEAAPTSGVEEGPTDFGRWLARDLRAKGSPSQVPGVERPSQPPTVVIPVPEQAELASWLLRDLRPRSSAPPDAGVRMESLPPSSSPAAMDSVAALEVVLPPDSLMPHTVSEAPLSLVAPLEPALDDDDLAVLPSRRGKGAEGRRRRALLLIAALLGVAGLALWLRAGGQVEANRSAEAAEHAPLAAAALPPPPPAIQEEIVGETALPAPTSAPRRAAGGDPAASIADRAERGRRSGDAVARFADLPLATQAKLAREERQKARAHDASARTRKAVRSSGP